MPSLTRSEARQRAELISVSSMEVDLDLARADETGEETFASTTTIRFACAQPGASTFLDLKPAELRSLTLNGAALDPSGLGDGRIELHGLEADNVLVAVATMRYSRDGQGLHRAVDPADGQHYVYGHLFLDAAPSVFACFDQPDLKAPYAVSVTAPEGWQVIGNGAAAEVEPGRWELARTKPLATYFVTVCAGPWASVRSEHDGIPLGIHARASLREPLERQAEQMLEVTRACFDYYHRLFGIRYPFGEYHQVFVPEFNAGAMENPGCVTFRDTYVFRGAAARDEVLTRSNTIAHEMAHMWFGDLVTMRWWDDLWLNESFAEYMAHRTSVDATEFTEGWVDSTVARKMWGYAAERTPSTHPVAGGAALDAQAALQDFDGISYAKGAATLRQLIAHIGDDAFIAGVSAYLREHAYGNGTLADFLGSMERASGQDLGEWSKAWLLTAGLDVIAADQATRRRHPRRAGGLPRRPAAHPRRGGLHRRGRGVPRRRHRHRGADHGARAQRGAPGGPRRAQRLGPHVGDRRARPRHAGRGAPGARAGAGRPGPRRAVGRTRRRRLPRQGRPAPGGGDLRPGLAEGGQRVGAEPHRHRGARTPRDHVPAAGRAARGEGRHRGSGGRAARGERARFDPRPPRGPAAGPQLVATRPGSGPGPRPPPCRPGWRRTPTSAGSWCATSPGRDWSMRTSSRTCAARTTPSRVISVRWRPGRRCPAPRPRRGPGSS